MQNHSEAQVIKQKPATTDQQTCRPADQQTHRRTRVSDTQAAKTLTGTTKNKTLTTLHLQKTLTGTKTTKKTRIQKNETDQNHGF
jgi:hypothetical protein